MKFESGSPSYNNDPRLSQALKLTYDAFRAGDFALAEVEAEKALAVSYDDPEVLSALKCAVFWKERILKLQNFSLEEGGDYLLKEYQGFLRRFLQRLDMGFEEGLFAIRQFIFSRAAELYWSARSEAADPAALTVKTAKAYKGSGDFDRAIGCLEDYLIKQQDDAQALAELADCYEMTNETKKAKLFFREAFFINAQKIDLDMLQSVMIRSVRESLSDKGFTPALVKEWVPVYGVIQGVFLIKRDLKPLELGQLKQSIVALRNELQEGSGQQALLLPRLINRYFWLIDYYLSVKEDRSKIEEILLNIKMLDKEIYELYTH